MTPELVELSDLIQRSLVGWRAPPCTVTSMPAPLVKLPHWYRHLEGLCSTQTVLALLNAPR